MEKSDECSASPESKYLNNLIKWSPQERYLSVRFIFLTSVDEILDCMKYGNCPFITLHSYFFLEPPHHTLQHRLCVTDFLDYVPGMKIHSGHLTRPRDFPDFPQQQIYKASLRRIHFCRWLSFTIFFKLLLLISFLKIET